MTPRTLVAGVLIAGISTAITACGSDDSSSSNQVTTIAAGSGASAMNDAEVEFSQSMIAHHEQAIEMAEIALDPTAGASPEVADLARRIKDAQDPEVQLMTGWLTAAGQPVVMDMSDGHDMSSMEGMMSADQMDALAQLTGEDFDRLWLEMMIAHHEGAISQSETVKSLGANPDVLALADAIIAAQQAEILEMQDLLEG